MKKKNRIFNIIMSVAIVAIAVSGLMMVGANKGWFDKSDRENNANVTASFGLVSIERSKVAYLINEQTALRDKDIIETMADSRVIITSGENTFVLAENSEVKIIAANKASFSLQLTKGEMFAIVNEENHFAGLTLGVNTLSVNKTVFSANMQTGSYGIYVYDGEVTLDEQRAQSGEIMAFVKDKASVTKLNATSLNDFNLDEAMAASKSRQLCFTSSELKKVTTDREAEIEKIAQERANYEAEIIARGGTVKVAHAGKEGTTANQSDTSGTNVLTCTITIRCDTILDNMADLTEGKNAYVPSNGRILATSPVQFVEGETVFDVLKRACSAAGIQLEYSWTPMYNSYYIEGINNLYEFDCGNESGWMYKVNGWFPNYGCSSYALKGGDVIVWSYTCKGLGADVGGSVY